MIENLPVTHLEENIFAMLLLRGGERKN